MKKYKNYIIAAVILIVGVFIGKLTSGDNNTAVHDQGALHDAEDHKTQIWTCSMHPQIQMDKPGNCPICGMELIPLEMSKNRDDAIAPDEIVMTEEAIQLANIQTSQVVRSNATKEVRLLGTVKPDERRMYSQVSHIPGRIEQLYVNFTGEKVSKGQKMVRLYSPELISAQKELFEAIKSKEVYPQLFKASRNKLKLWKLTDSQIDAMISSGKVQEQIDILSDFSGYVMKRNVELGDHVMEGMKLFDIANIDKVWLMFEAYEADIPWVHKGDMVEFTLEAMPGSTYSGKVTYIDPFVSAGTRVAKVRVEANNPGYKLMPGMYANGTVSANISAAKDALIIPKSAVLWTGKNAVTYVKVPHDQAISFIYRQVILGADLGDFYVVEEGLKEGEEIATNGVFRIDASAQLLGQKSMMNPNGGKVNSGTQANLEANGPEIETKNEAMPMTRRLQTSQTFKNQLNKVFDDYIQLKNALVADDSKAASSSAQALLTSMSQIDMKALDDRESHELWMAISEGILSAAQGIASNSSIETQRNHFKVLSVQLSKSVKLFGVNKQVYEQYCPMADNDKGAYWLSLTETIENPYFGSKMMKCGSVESVIE
jgi:Cu(I)/Ag(I) efflux system membrane fusion protein